MQTQLTQKNSALVLDLTDTNLYLLDLSDSLISLGTWLTFALVLFILGLFGMIFNYKNFLVTMMSVELMYLGAISSFVLYGVALQDPRGAIYALVLLILAACESAVGLGLLILIYRFNGKITFTAAEELQG
jgi:NADH-quinone oxidoreductase subunit K